MTEHELAAGRQLSETKCVNKIYNIEIYVFFYYQPTSPL